MRQVLVENELFHNRRDCGSALSRNRRSSVGCRTVNEWSLISCSTGTRKRVRRDSESARVRCSEGTHRLSRDTVTHRVKQCSHTRLWLERQLCLSRFFAPPPFSLQRFSFLNFHSHRGFWIRVFSSRSSRRQSITLLKKYLKSLGRLSAENARVSEKPHLDLLPFLRLVWKSGVETQRNRNGVLWPG